MADKEKKIIVDKDWKEEAKHEKAKLVAQEKAEKEEKEEEDKKEEDKKAEKAEKKEEEQKEEEQSREPVKLPSGDFAALLSMLTSQAFYALGMLEVGGQKKEPDLEMARYNIDMLTTLQEKTKGNLNEQEEAVLESTLEQVRMAFVKAAG